MKITLKLSKDYDVKFLLVNAKVRYWEDSEVNGSKDTESGDHIPCKKGDSWCPKIDIDTGIIVNWRQGTIADIHYKVVDEGVYTLTDAEGNMIVEKDGYVPDIMCPEESGYGDYIIMKVRENGQICNWEQKLSYFEEEDYD